MQKLRILETGWESFTGDFGSIEFANGVSVDPVAPVYARRLANTIRVEAVDEAGESAGNPSDAQRVIDYGATPAAANMNDKVESAVNPVKVTRVYTRDDLLEIADKGGIVALRKVGDGMGVKSNSLANLIDKILTTQQVKLQPSSDLGLLGSSVQPTMFVIDNKEFTLGDIVRAAFDDSGMATCEWNEQNAESREALIAAAVAKLGAVGKVALPEITVVDPDALPVQPVEEPVKGTAEVIDAALSGAVAAVASVVTPETPKEEPAQEPAQPPAEGEGPGKSEEGAAGGAEKQE